MFIFTRFIHFDFFFLSIHLCSLHEGDIVLYSKMVMEIMGGWKNSRADARSRHRHLLRNRKETKEEAIVRLLMGQFTVSFLYTTTTTTTMKISFQLINLFMFIFFEKM